jgi:hypothetical protein
MENSELISGLIAKREEALNDIVVLKKQILVKRADLKAIESAIAVVTPSIAAAKRIATRHARSRYFTSGELSRRCQDALRNARGEWITAEDIALIAMKDKALDPSNVELRGDFTRRLLWTLNRFTIRGAVQKDGWGTAARWRATN